MDDTNENPLPDSPPDSRSDSRSDSRFDSGPDSPADEADGSPASPQEGIADGQEGEELFDDESQEELFMNRASGLDRGPGRVIAIASGMLMVLGYILYSLFFDKGPVTNYNTVEATRGIEDTAAGLSLPSPPSPLPRRSRAPAGGDVRC